MRKMTIVIAMLALMAVPAAAQEWTEMLAPDAAFYAVTIDGQSVGLEGISYVLAAPAVVQERRVWLDVLRPATRPGLGISLDVVPAAALAIGGGYQADYGGVVYLGAHADTVW